MRQRAAGFASPTPRRIVETLACGHRLADPGQTHYCTYLRLDELLSLQPGPGQARHPEEHLFVVTHQAFELWFTQLRTDLPRVIEALQRNDAGTATWLMNRCTAIVRMFSPMMRVLETMTLGGFYSFRHHLVPASGGESGQWHEIELLSGAREPELLRYLQAEPRPDDPTGPQVGLWTPCLAELWDAPSVSSAAKALFEARGVSPADAYEASHAGAEHWDLVLLAEALLEYDEEVRIWRFVHARTAERTIGPDAEGTGHTTGVRFLERMAVVRASFFPFLWSARGELWNRTRPAAGQAGS
jgi:tryptophan 2,3-dioxygenase